MFWFSKRRKRKEEKLNLYLEKRKKEEQLKQEAKNVKLENEDTLTKLENKEEDKKIEVVKEKNDLKDINAKEIKDSEKSSNDLKKETSSNEKALLGQYLITQIGDGFIYSLKASNGQIIVNSEKYSTVFICQNAILNLKKNKNDLIIEMVSDKSNKIKFVVKTKQSRILCESANYQTKKACESAKDSFMRFIDSKKIVLSNDSNQDLEFYNSKVNPENGGKISIVSEDDSFKFLLKAVNGRLIYTSKVYKTKKGLLDFYDKFKEEVYQGTFYILKDKFEHYYFKLSSKVGKTVCVGSAFDSKNKCLANIDAIYKYTKNSKMI